MDIKTMLQRFCEHIEYTGYTGNHDYYSMFGEYEDIIGCINEKSAYIWSYSDAQKHNPFRNARPDAIVILDDGRCVFLYEVSNV